MTKTHTTDVAGTADTEGERRSSAVLDKLASVQAEVMEHPVYKAVDAKTLPLFMEHHVFAVLDFMWLLKSLQVSLTSTDVAWIPHGDPTARRLVNEIVLGEESDTVDGRNISHFDLYVEAMTEVGADTGPILACVEAIRSGSTVPTALAGCGGPPAAIRFSLITWELASSGGLHERVAAFAFGREEIIPDMFTRLLDDADDSQTLSTFEKYLERHIEVDGDLHGPLALELVRTICGNDPVLWQQTEDASLAALRNRAQLWDAVVAAV